MSSPVLVTKLFIPTTRPEFVRRARLVKRLNEGLHRKLTLISAPAGFGKTTLVAEWMEGLQGDPQAVKTTWLSIDEGDNEPTRFLIYLIAALDQVQNGQPIGKQTIALLQSSQSLPFDAALTPLVNEIAAFPDKIVLVLDDLHLIDSQQVNKILFFLLENLPAQLHLVITTREDPLLPLSRLRVSGQLTELRAADLRFTVSEATEFLNQVMGLNLSPQSVAALEERTEGWIAGLQLAAISLKGQADTSRLIQSFTGSNRLVLDYLIEEVLNQQPQNVQDFLLQTAILSRLNGSLCDSVTGQNNSQIILESLERANLFIVPLDNERRWYRYHHLFSDLLRQRLNQIQSDMVLRLHRNAGKWYENQGFVTEALRHIFAIRDYTWAVRIIEDNGSDKIWKEGDWQSVHRWMGNFPNDIVHSRPELCLLSAWLIDSSGNPEPFEPFLESVEAYLALGESDTENRDLNGVDESDSCRSIMSKDVGSMKAEIATIRAVNACRCGDLTRSIELYNLALEVVPKDNQFLHARAIAGLAENHFLRGEVNDAQRLYTEAHSISEECGYVHWASSVV